MKNVLPQVYIMELSFLKIIQGADNNSKNTNIHKHLEPLFPIFFIKFVEMLLF